MTPAARALLLAALAAIGFAVATRPTPWGPLAFVAATLLHAAIGRSGRRAVAATVTAVAAIGPASVAMTALAPLQPLPSLVGLLAIAASFASVGALAFRKASHRWRQAAVPVAVVLLWCSLEAAWGAPWLAGRYALPVLSVGSALADGSLRALASWAGTTGRSAVVLGVGAVASVALPVPAVGATHHGTRAEAGRPRPRKAHAIARRAAGGLLLVGASVASLPRGPLDARPGEVVVASEPAARVLPLRLVQHVPTPQTIAAASFDLRERARASTPLLVALDDSDGRLVVWPEAAWPRPIARDDLALASAPRSVPASSVVEALPSTATVLFGAGSVDRSGVRNSVLLLRGGRLDVVADKVRLVPATEGGLVAGEAGATFTWGGAVLAAAICWDAAFPGVARAAARAGSDVLIYLANDAYAGRGPVGRLHLRQARLRAVETGMPVVFVQATGPSAAIDASGRVLALLPAGARGHLDVDLPLPARAPVPKGGGA